MEADKRRVVSIALYRARCTAIVPRRHGPPPGRGTPRTSCGTPGTCSASA